LQQIVIKIVRLIFQVSTFYSLVQFSTTCNNADTSTVASDC